MNPNESETKASSIPNRINRRKLLRYGVPAAAVVASGAAITGIAVAEENPFDRDSEVSSDELESELAERIDELLADSGTQIEASVAVSQGSRRLLYNDDQVHDTASIVKMTVLAMLLDHHGDPEVIPAAQKALAHKMITESDNDATTELYDILGGCDALEAAHGRFGMTSTHVSEDCRWGLTTTVASDQLAIAGIDLFSGEFTLDQVKYSRELMGDVIDDQNWGVSAAAESGEKVWLKNGWDTRSSLDDLWVVNSVGAIAIPEQNAVRMSILTSKAVDDAEGIPIVEDIAVIARDVVTRD